MSVKPLSTQSASSKVGSCRPEISFQGNALPPGAPGEAEKFTLSQEDRLGASLH